MWNKSRIRPKVQNQIQKKIELELKVIFEKQNGQH
jgi:hypothetical protein